MGALLLSAMFLLSLQVIPKALTIKSYQFPAWLEHGQYGQQ